MNVELITTKEIIEKLQRQDYTDKNTLIALAHRIQKLEEDLLLLKLGLNPDHK